MYLKVRQSDSHPDLRIDVAEAASQIVINGVTQPVEREQIEVLTQQTYVVDPGQVPAEDERSAVTSCLTRIHELPPEGELILLLMLASQKSPTSEFLPGGHKVGVFPDPPGAPFYEINLDEPRLGMTAGTIVNDQDIRTLRAVLPDGTVYEDSVSNSSLLILVPIYANRRIRLDELPKFQLLTSDGDDRNAPRTVPLE